MRVKQTARKSTASGPGPSQNGSQLSNASASSSSNQVAVPNRTRQSKAKVVNDPLKMRINNLLQTKRKSATPSQRESFVSQAGNTSGQIVGQKKIYADQVKTKPRSKSGEMALKEIRHLQKGYQLLIPRAAFHRVVREVTHNIMGESGNADQAHSIRYQTAALEALQEATESYLVHLFEDSYLCCLHAKRVTLFIQDMQLCRRLQTPRGI